MSNQLKLNSRGNEKTKALLEKGYIPGIVSGKNVEPIKVYIKEQELKKHLKSGAEMFNFQVPGAGKQMAHLQEVQKNPKNNRPIHVSFNCLATDEEVTVSIPIQFTGTAAGRKQGGLVLQTVHHLDVSGFAKNLPDYLEADMSEMNIGDHIKAEDIKLPKGVELKGDSQEVLAVCQAPKVAYTEEEEQTTDSIISQDISEEGPEQEAA